jgi:hypothetical protein
MSTLTPAQKAALYREGFLILRQAVDQPLVRAARRQIHISQRSGVPTTDANRAVAALFNDSALKPLLESGLGVEVPPVAGGQMAVLHPSPLEHKISESGYSLDEIPHYAWQGHLDGLWNGSTAPLQTADEDDAAWFGRDQEGIPTGTNGVKFWLDEERSLSISGFSCLVGVAVSDQTMDGDGQVGILPGAHHHMERFFRWQLDQGGPLGPDGPGWPRIDTDAPNGHGLRHYPEVVREQIVRERGGSQTPDGRWWPRPELVKLQAGDAVLVLHAVPHGGSHVAGPDPRMCVSQCMPAGTPAQLAGWLPVCLLITPLHIVAPPLQLALP